MKLNASVSEFSKAVTTAARAITKTTGGVLDCLYMTASGTTLYLKGSDNDLTIITDIPANVRVEGEAIIPVRTLMELARTFPPEATLLIDAMEPGRVTLTCNSAQVTLAAGDPREYPRISASNMGGFFGVPNAAFRDMIRQTIFACAVSENVGPILKGVCVECSDGRLRFVGMNGFVMAVRTESIPDNAPTRCVVPARTMNEIMRVLTAYDSDALVSVSSGRFIISVGHTQISSNLLAGEYLNYAGFIPSEVNAVVKFNVQEVLAGVERTHLLREHASICALFSFRDDSLSIFAQSSGGSVQDEFEVSKSGIDLDIALDSQYLLECLKAISDERAVIELRSDRYPLVIRPVGSDRFLYLIMPTEIPSLYSRFLKDRQAQEE